MATRAPTQATHQLATGAWTPEQGWRVKAGSEVALDDDSAADALPLLDSRSTLVLAFGSPDITRSRAGIAELARAFPTSHILGCSTAGEILGATLTDGGLGVGIIKFQHSRLSSCYAPIRGPQDSFIAGATIAHQLEGAGLRAVFLLSDGLNINGSELVAGLNSVLASDVIVSGGLAADGTAFKSTWTIRNGAATTGFVTAVGLYGDRLRVGFGSKAGWEAFGPQRKITRSEGQLLLELDNKPALDLYKQYLGERAGELPSAALLLPMAVREQPGRGDYLVRTVLGVDEARNGLQFAGNMPEGFCAQLMRADFDRVIAASGHSAYAAHESSGSDGACLAIAISCVGRRLILGNRTCQELQGSLCSLPRGSMQVGFYSYGEVSPLACGRAELHNQTMTLTTFREE